MMRDLLALAALALVGCGGPAFSAADPPAADATPVMQPLAMVADADAAASAVVDAQSPQTKDASAPIAPEDAADDEHDAGRDVAVSDPPDGSMSDGGPMACGQDTCGSQVACYDGTNQQPPSCCMPTGSANECGCFDGTRCALDYAVSVSPAFRSWKATGACVGSEREQCGGIVSPKEVCTSGGLCKLPDGPTYGIPVSGCSTDGLSFPLCGGGLGPSLPCAQATTNGGDSGITCCFFSGC